MEIFDIIFIKLNTTMNQITSKKEEKYIDYLMKLMNKGKFESVITEGKNYIKEYREQVFFISELP